MRMFKCVLEAKFCGGLLGSFTTRSKSDAKTCQNQLSYQKVCL